jgi:GAF domain-containing protein
MEFLECDVFFNYLVDKEKGCLHLNAYAGIPEEEAQKIEWLDYGVAVCGCAALESRRIIAENILETPDPGTDLVKGYGVQAYACHPLMAEGVSIGTLSFGTNSRTKFTGKELELMKAVADQIAIAMNRLISNRILKESEKTAIQARNEWEHTFEAVPDLIAILTQIIIWFV